MRTPLFSYWISLFSLATVIEANPWLSSSRVAFVPPTVLSDESRSTTSGSKWRRPLTESSSSSSPTATRRTLLSFALQLSKSRNEMSINDNEVEMKQLYETVARNDPEWFENFVVNIMGEENVPSELIQLARESKGRELKALPGPTLTDTTMKSEQKEKVREKEENATVADGTKSSDQVDPTKLSAKETTASQETDANNKSSLNELTKTALEGLATELSDISLKEEAVSKVDNMSLENEMEKMSEGKVNVTNTTTVNQSLGTEKNITSESKSSSSNGKVQESENSSDPNTKIDIVLETVSKTKETKQNDTGIATIPKSNATATSNADQKILSATNATDNTVQDASKEMTVLYRSDLKSNRWKKLSLESLQKLGYKTTEIQTLDPSALDLIVAEGISKPRSGVPSRWKVMIAPNKAAGRSTEPDTVNNPLVTIIPTDSVPNFIANNLSQMMRGEKTAVAAATDEMKNSTDVPNDESQAVASDHPRRHNSVELASSSDRIFVTPPPPKTEKEQDSATTRKGKFGDETLEKDRENRQQPSRLEIENDKESSSRARQRQTRPPQNGSDGSGEMDEIQSRQRRSRREGSEKNARIYTGRPGPAGGSSSSSSKRRRQSSNEPDPPSQGPWPDMDTFRGMLRNEAALRLRILGDDWSDVVKDESDWRLNLYRSWLWTLNNGVGKPMVESRSDRMRRAPQRPQPSRPRSQRDVKKDDDDIPPPRSASRPPREQRRPRQEV